MVMHMPYVFYPRISCMCCSQSKECIISHSKIYGRNTKSNLTYQENLNRVAMELCLLQNCNLLSNQKVLMESSRKQLNDLGYIYKKGKSQSKVFSSSDGEPPVNKRPKTIQRFCLSKISELQEEIKDNTEQTEYKELSREGA